MADDDMKKIMNIINDGMAMIEELKERGVGREETSPATIAAVDQIKKRSNDLLDSILKAVCHHIEKDDECRDTDCPGAAVMILIATLHKNAPDDLISVMFVALYRLAVQQIAERANAEKG